MNGERQKLKTLGKDNITSLVRNCLPLVHKRECKTNYPANKRFSLVVSGNRISHNTHKTKHIRMIHGYGSSFIFVDLNVPVCMTLLPPCKHNFQKSLSLPFAVFMIHFSLTLTLSAHPGVESPDGHGASPIKCAGCPALFALLISVLSVIQSFNFLFL
jgi:hypothetical protein